MFHHFELAARDLALFPRHGIETTPRTEPGGDGSHLTSFRTLGLPPYPSVRGSRRAEASVRLATLRENGATMTVGNVEGDQWASTSAVSPQERPPYVAPFLRRLDFSDTAVKRILRTFESSTTTGPS